MPFVNIFMKTKTAIIDARPKRQASDAASFQLVDRRSGNGMVEAVYRQVHESSAQVGADFCRASEMPLKNPLPSLPGSAGTSRQVGKLQESALFKMGVPNYLVRNQG